VFRVFKNIIVNVIEIVCIRWLELQESNQGDLPPSNYHLLPWWKQNLGRHISKGECDLELLRVWLRWTRNSVKKE